MDTIILNLTWIIISLIVILVASIAFKEISKELKKTNNLPHKKFTLKYARIIAVFFIIYMISTIFNCIMMIIEH